MSTLTWNRAPTRSLRWAPSPPRTLGAISDDAVLVGNEIREAQQQREMSVTEKVAVAGLVLGIVGILLQWRQLALWKATLKQRQA